MFNIIHTSTYNFYLPHFNFSEFIIHTELCVHTYIHLSHSRMHIQIE